MHELLENQVKNNSMSHAYIFEGGIEETRRMYVDFIGNIFLPDNPSHDMWQVENFVDVEILRAEKNIITIDKIRDLKKKVYELPLEGKYKVFVIEEADLMRSEAQNALLKTLEETPEYAIIILTTDNRNKLYDTILSRCQLVSTEDEGERQYTEEELYALIDIFIKAYNGDYYAIVTSKTFFEKFTDRKKEIISMSQRFFSDLALYNIGITDNFSSMYKNKLSIFDKLSMNKLEGLILRLENINDLLKVNINFQLAMENLLFALVEE